MASSVGRESLLAKTLAITLACREMYFHRSGIFAEQLPEKVKIHLVELLGRMTIVSFVKLYLSIA